jgi:YbbR domain-containing protein
VNLRAILLDDWPLKVTSLFLSVLLWVVASTEEPGSLVVAVTVIAQPPHGRSVIGRPPEVNVLFTGSRRELMKLGATQVSFSRIVPDTVSGRSITLDLSPSDLEVPRGVAVRVQEIEPRQVIVELDSLQERSVPVHPDVRIQAEVGSDLIGAIQVVPGIVRLSGPANLLSRVDSVSTVTLRLTRAQGEVERRLAIDTTGLGPLRVIPGEVTVALEVAPVSERAFDAVPVELPDALAASVTLDHDRVLVHVRGLARRLRTLTTDSVHVFLDPSTTPANGRAPLRLLLPPPFTGRVVPDSVTLSRRVSG